jgi:hypothetical protein
MVDETYRFCKIFVQLAEPPVVTDLLARLLDVAHRSRTIDLPDAAIDILYNPDTGAADDFIGWPTIVEIEANPDGSNASILATTAKIVTALWDAGYPAVAACDYEDELPWRGGLARLNAPDQ